MRGRRLRARRAQHRLADGKEIAEYPTKIGTMCWKGSSTRFTPNEVDELRQVGLDLAEVKCQNDIDAEVTRRALTLAYERFDLLEQIAAVSGASPRLTDPLSNLQRCDLIIDQDHSLLYHLC